MSQIEKMKKIRKILFYPLIFTHFSKNFNIEKINLLVSDSLIHYQCVVNKTKKHKDAKQFTVEKLGTSYQCMY